MLQRDMDKLEQFKKNQEEVIEVIREQCDLDIQNNLNAKKDYKNAVKQTIWSGC